MKHLTMKYRALIFVFCILLLVAGVVSYRKLHDHWMLNEYFEFGEYGIINRHHAFANFSRMSYTVFNLETHHVSPKPILSEVKCAPWISLVPHESIFYKPRHEVIPDNERQTGLHLAGIEVKCYQVASDVGKGFPDISVYFQQSTGRATIQFPF